MPFGSYTEIKNCCGCIPDLRTASAIITVLAIVTNPTLSWLMIRRAYTMHVSCNLAALSRFEIVDVTINNIVSFGFGGNSGLGPSCLSSNGSNSSSIETTFTKDSLSHTIVVILGCIVLAADLIFLIVSIVFLVEIYRKPTRLHASVFMVSGVVALLLSTLYGIFFVIVCAMRRSGVAICDLVLSFIHMALWIYFLMVVKAYSKQLQPRGE